VEEGGGLGLSGAAIVVFYDCQILERLDELRLFVRRGGSGSSRGLGLLIKWLLTTYTWWLLQLNAHLLNHSRKC
jgi:hypothetical protein